MRTHRAFLAMMLAPVLGALRAQTVHVDTIAMVQPFLQQERYTFPRITMPGALQVAQRIQRDLSTDLLEVDPDTAEGQWFDMVWGDTSGGMPRLNSIDWSVTLPRPRILSVEFSAEGCGAYCEGFTVHRVYDLRSGQRLAVDTLFDAVALSEINDTLARAWHELVSDHLASIRDSLAAPPRDSLMRDFYKEAEELYAQCLEEHEEALPYITDLVVEGSALSFYISRCSAHWNQNADELDPVHFELSLTWLLPRMRPEYRALFVAR